VAATGVGAVDQELGGGLPVGALTEMVGAEGSGRTSLALKFVAEMTAEGRVCAWVDVSDALRPEAAAACGVDLGRMLWVRCGRHPSQSRESFAEGRSEFSLPAKYRVAPPAVKGLHGGGFGGHPRGEGKGMGEAVEGLLRGAGVDRVVGTPRGCGGNPTSQNRDVGHPEGLPVSRYHPTHRDTAAMDGAPERRGLVVPSGRVWARMEQGLRVTDLLLQAGGFAVIVLDLGSVTAECVSRIPLATWFRYRAAAERTRACVVLLTQHACAKSSAGLVLRMESGEVMAREGTVLAGFARRMDVARQRFAEQKVVAMRKPPQRAGVATWESRAAWAGLR